MDGTLTFSEQLGLKQEMEIPDVLDLVSTSDIPNLVSLASRVIAPLGPISEFAARSPWMGLENQFFDEVARWLKDIRDVDIYPGVSLLRDAMNRGEIDPKLLDKGLQRWLDSQSLQLPRDVAERFCRAALELDDLPSVLLEAPELKNLIGKLSVIDLPIKQQHSLQTLSFRMEQQTGVKLARDLDRHVIKWCKLFLDGSHTAWSLPSREEGFYRAWHRLVQYDPALNHSQHQLLKKCPREAIDALMEALAALEISPCQIQHYLEAHLLSLPGWAGMMLWRSQQTPEEESLLIEYLAVRITLEWALIKPYLPLPEQQSEDQSLHVRLIAAWAHWGDLPLEAWSHLSASQQQAYLTLAVYFDEFLRRRIWLEAWEETYEERLKAMITSKQSISHAETPVLVQVAFCIDTRSEPFRRALEKAGPFETFGVAGFFGLPIETCKLGSSHSHASLPVMLKPQHKIKESASAFAFRQYEQRRQTVISVKHTFQIMKQNVLTSLLLPEVSGPWLSLQMLARSFFPRKAGRTFRKLRHEWLQKPSTELSLDYMDSEVGLPIGFSEEEKVYYVRQALNMMGLTKNFSPLVIICGHGSHSTNNPYAAALDCGACGGASGGFNARVLATLCNSPKVREILGNDGISIPKDTVFVAAEHITTLNELRWLYVPELSEAAQEAFDGIRGVLPKVSEHVNAEQLSRLPSLGFRFKHPKIEVQRFAEDWSEVRPEWGLARNAAFIIGTRQLTKACDLDGRVFLHSYDWQKDDNGSLLSNIIAGPATVAQWINLQYYGSTVAPYYYGSGNKVTQTVTAGVGVMQGNASDLLVGFPWQSVMKSDEEFYHAPLRLLVIIEAPEHYVERLLAHDAAFCQKVQNGWIRLAMIDPKGRWES
ncbi:hypothetical protein AYW79_11805 [Ferroacidibacillus organovorans]|uniref:Probable inorganic carbon transporter subunit DabA n=2 Tax=Ferroacidibacillus organovorans TaxID=1765683 RepID=A0A853K9Y3_9BACL|nr:hypothetical protein AYJ22_12085 [Ferroacidibacillus organovorans]OAG93218.1 hypothetical protein AYW79_11805 [Ferroacidibacillus organovorans]